MPPFSGFVAKLALIRAGLESQQSLLVAIALVVGLLTLLSVATIWAEAFWKPSPVAAPRCARDWREARDTLPQGLRPLLVSTATLAGLSVALGLGAEPVFTLARGAAEQLLDPTDYIRTVLERPL